MGQPVVHFEVIGSEPQRLRTYYAQLFGWQFDTSGPVAEVVSEPGNYGFTLAGSTPDGVGIPGGVGGGSGYAPRASFYVGVPEVEAALQRAEQLGGTPVSGPHRNVGGLVVGFFRDPEGNLIGLAGGA